MRHHKRGRTLGRPRDQKRALMRSLATSLIMHERISTTEAKAKELRPFIEKLITHAKKNTVGNRRLVASRLGGNSPAVTKLFTALAPRYEKRAGGYVRIVKRAPSANGRRTAYIAFV